MHFAIYTLKLHTHFQIHLKFASNRLTISIIIMKFALAFVLLIGISCHIGRGDCAPDGLYESFTSMVSGAFSATQDTYRSVMNQISPREYMIYIPINISRRHVLKVSYLVKNYLFPPAYSISSYLPSLSSVSDSISSHLPTIPSVSDSISSGLSNMKESAENLGSKAGDMMKSGENQISDAVNY
ncbi:hypothetical protein AGLY_011189 [Aphis glycines]|uniref:Uncharacterized protein n=1 Tax=Aphis glycines TaxID=307491 RepID=A0A6G0TEZ0_APHGL|nr:hypothetical protein AGLY_011189 [Aphis glycines]